MNEACKIVYSREVFKSDLPYYGRSAIYKEKNSGRTSTELGGVNVDLKRYEASELMHQNDASTVRHHTMDLASMSTNLIIILWSIQWWRYIL